jgi:hypothetical protein
MLINTKSKFHLALNGFGLLLQGSPDRLGYQKNQSPIYGQRFASGDRDYNDLSQWWYFIQKDWSSGVKDETSWKDDAKFFYSTNMDVWSKIGSIKLSKEQYPAGSGGDNNFTDEIICGVAGALGTSYYNFIGTTDTTDNRPHVWKADPGENQAWTDISTTNIGTQQNTISQLSTRLGILWASIVGIGSTDKLKTYDGSSWVDQSGLIDAVATTRAGGSSRTHCEALGALYAFKDHSAGYYALLKTVVANPTASASWTLCFEKNGTDGLPVASRYYDGSVYYLVNYSYYMELWAWNIAESTNTLVRRFNNCNSANWGLGDKLLVELNGKLIITIPSNEIWELNGAALTRIFTRDEFKKGIATSEIDCQLYYGAVAQDNKLWWGNLMYDGTNFFNTWKGDADGLDKIYPIFSDFSNRIWETYSQARSVLWSVNLDSTRYKGTTGKNYIVFSNFDNISGVDKLAQSVTILFDPFLSGQKIIVKYISGEFTSSATWTTLGEASYTTDGGVVTSKKLFFPVGTTFNKLWIRIELESGGTDTPALTDFVMEYLPAPSPMSLWSLNINANESLKTLDGSLCEQTGREIRSLLEKAWWTKSALDFQDFDYATTTLSDNPLSSSATTITVPTNGTEDFPEQGRLKIDYEEIFYTGKTPTTFTGCIRGFRNTRAVAHSLNAVINNAYKVIVTDLQTRVPIALQDKHLEYIVGVTLREV